MLIMVIRNECNVKQLQKALEEKKLIKIDGMRKAKEQLKVSYPELSNGPITVRLRKLCNCLIGLDPGKMKEKQANILTKNFLKNCVIGSLDIKKLYF